MCQINIPILISSVTIIVSIATFSIAYTQMKIASAKTKLDLYNKRFKVYESAFDYYQSTWYDSHEKIQEKSLVFTKAFRESQFLFKITDGIYLTLEKIQKNGGAIYFYKKHKYEIENQLTKDIFDLNHLHESSVKASSDFEKNLHILETQIDKYIQFSTISGWRLF